MRNAFCETVLNKVKWVLKLPKNGILLPLHPRFSPTLKHRRVYTHTPKNTTT